MSEKTAHRTLVVANRTASTPQLLDELKRRAAAGGTTFTLMIPPETGKDAHDWTQEDAVRMVGDACGGPVEYVDAGEDAGAAIKQLVEERQVDAIVLSTESEHHARWLHHDLPHRIQHVGVDVTVIKPESGWIGPLEDFPPQWSKHAVDGPGAY